MTQAVCRRCQLPLSLGVSDQSYARMITSGLLSVEAIDQLVPCCGVCTSSILVKLKQGISDPNALLLITRGELRLLMRRAARR
jgi:hypothetical protein